VNHEDAIAARIVKLLDEGSEQLDPKKRERLMQARWLALAQHRTAMRTQPLAALARPSINVTGRGVLAPRYLVRAAALTLALIGLMYVNRGGVSNDAADVDVALLTDELPISAYLDQQFDAWLKGSSR
jgi:hypothetical protein